MTMVIVPGRTGAVARTLRVLVLVEIALFLVPAVLHAGIRIPLGLADLDEPVIVPAAIVEGLIGLSFAVAAYAVFTRAPWAWTGMVSSHVFALVGTLIGIGATFSGEGERTQLNTVIHLIMLVVVAAGLALLWTAKAREALGRHDEKARRGPEGRRRRLLESR